MGMYYPFRTLKKLLRRRGEVGGREVTCQVGTKVIWTQNIHLLHFSYFWPEFPPELLLQTPTWDYSEFHGRPRALTKTRKIISEDESTSSLQGKWLFNPCTETTGCRPVLQNLFYSSSNHHRRSAWTKRSWNNLKRPASLHTMGQNLKWSLFFFRADPARTLTQVSTKDRSARPHHHKLL